VETRKTKIEKIVEFVGSIDGWLSVQEGIFLYKLARKLSDDANIVEIGSWKGKSTIWLASAFSNKENAKVYAVDSHAGSPERERGYEKINTFPQFQENIKSAGLDNKVIPLRKTSAAAAEKFNGKIDLLFIDGSHIYEAVKKDLELWIPKMKASGWLVMHDATVLLGPWKAAKRYVLFSGNFQGVGMLGSMIFAQYSPYKTVFYGFTNRLENFLSYLFIISYVKLRKIPFPKSWRKKISRKNYKNSIKKIAKINN